MKRNLARILALAAAMAAGASAFAQVTINGYYRGGVADLTNNGANSAAKNNINSLGIVDRLRLNLSYAAPDDMYGFKARLDATSGSDGKTSGWVVLLNPTNLITATTATSAKASATTSARYLQGYAKFFDGALKFTAGKLEIGDYSVYQNIGNYYLGNVGTEAPVFGKYLLSNGKGNTTGGIIQLFPIEGLSVAASMATPDTNAPNFHDFGVHGYYFIPDVGKFLVTSQLGQSNMTGASAINDDPTKAFVSAGFQYLGVPGLTATAAYRYNNSDSGAIAIVEYKQGPFFVDVAGDADFTASHYYAEGEISYVVIPQLKVRAYGAYSDKVDYGIADTLALVAGSQNALIGNQYLLGADLVFPIAKGEVVAGIAYADQAGMQIPLIVKVNF
jgi:hypothetical protein